MRYEKDFEDRFENTSLGAIHYMHHPGSPKSIIFLHGLGGTTKVWTRLVEQLPDNLDITLIDLLGHGKSDSPDIVYTIDKQFQVLKEFISGRKCGSSYIFGHSYGGWVAAYYAAQHCPCSGLILEDSAGLKEHLDSISQGGNIEGYIEGMLATLMSYSSNSGKEGVLRSILESDFREGQLTHDILSNITVPTLVIWGGSDKIGDSSLGKIFCDAIKGSALNIIGGAGHEPHYTNPREVSEIISGFI